MNFKQQAALAVKLANDAKSATVPTIAKYCEVTEKADQLLQAEIKTRMVEAVAQCEQIEQVLIKFANADSIDDKLDCHDKFLKALHAYFKVQDDAESAVFYNTYQVHQVDADHQKIVARG